ncbi:MAG: hypothetical protein ACLPZR_28320 [Solirubrobacteraceae bacterium]
MARTVSSRLAPRRRMAISDGSVTGLDETASLLAGRGADAQRVKLDVSDWFAVGENAAMIAEHFGVVHQLYDNAGIAFSRSVLETADPRAGRRVDDAEGDRSDG